MSEVRPGYKLTAIGSIPNDWDVVRLAEVGPIQTGPFGTILKAAEYSDGQGVPLISVGEIQRGAIRLRPDTPTVDVHVVRRLPKFVIREGDILFGRKGAVERSALVSADQEGWFLGSDGLRLRPRVGYEGAYLGYQFQTERVQHWLLENSIGTTMPSMNQTILGNVQVPKPQTETEQRVIAEALGDADALIAALEALIAKKRDIKRGAMQELLTGQRRVPGFRGSWTLVPFFETLTVATGQVDPRKEPFRSMVLVGPEHIEEATGKLKRPVTAAEQGAISGKYQFLRIPTQSGRGFRFDVGHRSDLIPATIPK